MPDTLPINNLQYRPEVWGLHYWFFIHTVAHSYPLTPNDITKRKYYDLIQNMPLFIPDVKMGDQFSRMLDAYPVSPYLDNRDSFIRWTYFIHNKVNAELGKEEWTLLNAVAEYNRQYDLPIIIETERFHMNRKTILFFFLIVILIIILLVLFKTYQ